MKESNSIIQEEKSIITDVASVHLTRELDGLEYRVLAEKSSTKKHQSRSNNFEAKLRKSFSLKGPAAVRRTEYFEAEKEAFWTLMAGVLCSLELVKV